MSLNDWDVAEGWNISNSVTDHLFGWLGSFVTMTTYLPTVLQDFFVEILIASALNAIIVLVYLIISFSLPLFFLVILIMVGLFFFNEIMNCYRRYKFRNQIRPIEESSDSDEDGEDMKQFKIVRKKKKPNAKLAYHAADKPKFEIEFDDLFPDIDVQLTVKQKPPVKLKDINNKIHSSPLFSGVMNSLNSVPATIISADTYSSLVVRKVKSSDRKRRMRIPRVSVLPGDENRVKTNSSIDPVLDSLKALSEFALDDFFDYYRGETVPFACADETTIDGSSIHAEHFGDFELMMQSMVIGNLASKRVECTRILYPDNPETDVGPKYLSDSQINVTKRNERAHRKRSLRPKKVKEEQRDPLCFQPYPIANFIVEPDQIPFLDIFEESTLVNDDAEVLENSSTAGSAAFNTSLRVDEGSDLSDDD